MSNVIEKAVKWAIDIANDDSHGYDQIKRWGDDFDCSSLVISSYEEAGIPVKKAGATYTGNMLSAFKKCGFVALPYKKGMDLIKGDILLNKKYHTVLYIGDGKIVQASINEKGKTTGGKTGDQTGKEISVGKFYEYSKGWDYVLRYPEEKQPSEPQNVAKLSDEEIAVQVINGKWGNGKEREKKLTEAGYDYAKIQAIVNQKLQKPSQKPKEENKDLIGIVATNKSKLNIRSGAGLNYGIIGTLAKGSKVKLAKKEGSWYKLADQRGYVSASYIKLV